MFVIATFETAGEVASTRIAAEILVAAAGAGCRPRTAFGAADLVSSRATVAIGGAESGDATGVATPDIGGIETAMTILALARVATDPAAQLTGEHAGGCCRGRNGWPGADGAGISLIDGDAAGDSRAPKTEETFQDRPARSAIAEHFDQSVKTVVVHATLPLWSLDPAILNRSRVANGNTSMTSMYKFGQDY